MTGRADRWITWTTTGCVVLLALIAATVSYLHMHALVALYGQPGWVAALTPMSVDGMIVAASTTLLADSRSGSRGGVLPWALLVVGSIASLAANVAVAEPTFVGRVIAAWPSFALTASYELLTRQVRRTAGADRGKDDQRERSRPERRAGMETSTSGLGLTQVETRSQFGRGGSAALAQDVQRRAWQWALANRAEDGTLPSGRDIAHQFGRHERWGRLVKRAGLAGAFSANAEHEICRAEKPANEAG